MRNAAVAIADSMPRATLGKTTTTGRERKGREEEASTAADNFKFTETHSLF